MKALKVFFAVFLNSILVTQVSAQVINYDDGSTYTLSEGEEIYITTSDAPLFKREDYYDQSALFRVQKPWPQRDFVPTVEDEAPVGSHEWCATYIPWSEGLTFSMISWQRYCDTNGDGVYSELDERGDG